MLSTTHHYLLGLTLSWLLFFSGCPYSSPIPIGNKNQADWMLEGEWKCMTEGYDFKYVTITRSDADWTFTIKPDGMLDKEEFKGWTLELEGANFLYIEFDNHEKTEYLIYKYKQELPSIYTWEVNPEVFKKLKYSNKEELQSLLKAHQDDSNAFLGPVRWLKAK